MKAVLCTLVAIVGLLGLGGTGCKSTRARFDFEVDEAARPIMQQWAEALGGRERTEKAKGWHYKYRTKTSLGETTTESWESPNGRQRAVTTNRGQTETLVSDGKHFWVKDATGAVREYEGAELQRATMREVITSVLQREPRRRGRITKVNDHAVRFELEDNPAIAEVQLDPATNLPVSDTIRIGNQTWTTRYAEWRIIDGIKVPFLVTTEAPDGSKSELRRTVAQTMEPPAGSFAKP